MPRFRKLPVEVEAMQVPAWGHIPESADFDDWCEQAGCDIIAWSARGMVTVVGDWDVQQRDWIVRDVDGGFYAVKAAAFAARFQPADAPLDPDPMLAEIDRLKRDVQAAYGRGIADAAKKLEDVAAMYPATDRAHHYRDAAEIFHAMIGKGVSRPQAEPEPAKDADNG